MDTYLPVSVKYRYMYPIHTSYVYPIYKYSFVKHMD